MHDKRPALLVRSRLQACAREQVLQRFQRGERAVHRSGANTVDDVGVHDHAFPGLLGKRLQRGLRVLGRDVKRTAFPRRLSERRQAEQRRESKGDRPPTNRMSRMRQTETGEGLHDDGVALST